MIKLSRRVKVISALCGVSLIFLAFTSQNNRLFDIAKNLEILADVYKEVNQYYVDDIDPNRLMRVGIDAMLKDLDPYTNYIPEDDIEDFRLMSTGQYGGIGSIISTRNGKVNVVLPYKDSPATKAGLKAGDEIIEIDGQNVQGKVMNEITTFLKGQANTKVNLKVKRYGKDELIPIEVTREKIQLNSVPYYGMLDNEVGYMQLTGFTRTAGSEVKNALESLKGEGAKKIIFDLRDNGGGLLSEAISICNLFIPKGKEVVSMRGKVDKWNRTHKTQSRVLDKDIPLVILVNGYSASASEIVSGVIQDYDRGVVLGKQTYGKGLVQSTVDIGYNAKVKVTTAKYYIPSGRCIQAIDYSQKDKNGKAIRITDSVAFHTANGRVVYDGKGIAPDVVLVNDLTYNPLLGYLKRKDLLFDFATKYYYEHDSIASPADFVLSHQEFEDFKTWLGDKAYAYEIPLDKTIKALKKDLGSDTIKVDINPEIQQLQNKVTDLKKTLFNDSEEIIKRLLAEEISARYYFLEGKLKTGLMFDNQVKKARELLNNEQEYNKILNP
ncbi:MAG: S41 family peptidase [Cytophagales bacterium]|nr:S41 family peptidase [Cytophagales bacterium]